MDINKLKEALKNEPAYRFNQATELVYKQLIEDWSDAQGLPLELRKKLSLACPLSIDAKLLCASDQASKKAVLTLSDGLKIEAVLMRHKDGRNTICVSSQVGCPMGCVFCATGKSGFERNLSSFEILMQLLFFARHLKKTGERIDNVVFMGMGEPFLNYGAVMDAVKLINEKNGFNIGARHISISTVGVIEGIEKLIDEPLQVNLAISLHAGNDQLRSKIVPANARYPLDAIFSAVYRYVKNTNRRVMFEYIMIDGINDSDICAKELAALVKGRISLKLAFVNLITYNPTGDFRPSKSQRVRKFKEILEAENIEVTERHRFGLGIEAACGQLAAKKK